MNTTTLDQLFPETTLDRARQLGAELSRNAWRAGDLAAYMTAYAHEHALALYGSPVTEEMIFEFLGDLWSVSGRTVRDWRDIARRFPDSVREEYAVLPFGHFRFASQYPGYEQDILTVAVRRMDDIGGRVPPLRWLRAQFAGVYRPAPEPEWETGRDDAPEQSYSAETEIASMLPADEPTGGATAGAGGEKGVNILARALGGLYNILETVELSQDDKRELHDILEQLGRFIQRIGGAGKSRK